MTDDRQNPVLSWVFALLSAAAGFVVTLFAPSILGHFLFAPPGRVVGQSLGMMLVFCGFLAAFPGAFYWGMFVLWKNRGRRRWRDVASAWVIYGAFIYAVTLVARQMSP